jgi:hypothetical protein
VTPQGATPSEINLPLFAARQRRESAMLQMSAGSIYFGPLNGRGPAMETSLPQIFSGRVTQACCVITGVDYGFTDGDHDLWRTTIVLTPSIDQDVVTVVAKFGLRDNSGFWDDRYDATISFCVLAEVQEPSPEFVSRANLYTRLAASPPA